MITFKNISREILNINDEDLTERFVRGDSARASEDETAAAIAGVHDATGMVICPHTAVGMHAACLRRGDPATPMVILATAHPAKFPDAVEAACGVRPGLPSRLADLMSGKERMIHVPNDLVAIEAVIAGELGR